MDTTSTSRYITG